MAVFIGGISGVDKKTITEFYTNKKWTFKNIDNVRNRPKNARYFADVWTIENNENKLYNIYKTPSGVLYGVKQRI